MTAACKAAGGPAMEETQNMAEPDQNPIFEDTSCEDEIADFSDIGAIADIEARCRALVRAERQLADREREFSEMSTKMAHELREAAEAIRDQERALKQAGGVPPYLKTRRERLARIRRSLRDKYNQLERTEAVLEERAREADQVLANRREIARQGAALQKREQRVVSLMARNKTITTLFYSVATIAIVAVLSWALADQAAPARYAVTAEIRADGRGRTLSEDELNEWQRYHESVLTDPSLMELASDRLGKRGIEELGQPGELAARLKSDLSFESSEPGRLVLELRGDGAGVTKRTLDTYAVSIVSLANGTKDQRAGGAGTKLTVDATVEPDPLVDERPVYAAGIGGGGLLVVGLGGMVLYRRLRAQHAAYEQGLIGGD